MNYKNELYCKDTMELMLEMEKDGILVNNIITSPPYGNYRGRVNVSSKENQRDRHMVRYDVYAEDRTDEEYIEWMVSLFNQFDKILAKNGTIIWNMSYATDNDMSKSKKNSSLYKPHELLWRFLYNIIERTNFTTVEKLVWKKSTALPNNVSPNKLTRITEDIFIFSRKDEIRTYLANKKVKSVREDTGQKYYENTYNFIEAKNNDGSNKLNKATFSTDLVTQLIDIYVVQREDTENIIFDPFMGTGTTANACVLKGYNYLGTEISEGQVEFSKERVEKTKKTLNKEG